MKKILSSIILLVAVLTSATAQKVMSDEWLDKALAAKKECIEKYNKNGLPFESGVYRRGDAPGHVEIDLQGLSELALLTMSTVDGVDYDHATWGNAKFIAADGTETWLSDVRFKYKRVEGDWFSVKVNLAGKPLSIGDKVYEDGVLEHANGYLLIDLKGKNWVKFVSDIGIDNGATDVASAKFRIQSTLARDEARALLRDLPLVRRELLPFVSGTVELWLTTPGTSLEKNCVLAQFPKFGKMDMSKYNAEIDRIEKMSSDKEKILAYIQLNIRLQQLYDVMTQIEWLNPAAVNKAYADFSKTKGYDKEKWQPKLDEFNELTKKDLSSLEDFEAAQKAVALKREIMLSNPAVTDDIIVTRFSFNGMLSRRAMAPQIGTQANNWSCQLSAARSGFDAELLQLSGIRSGKPTERSIYKASNGDVITDARLHWDADRILFTSTDSLKRFQVYEVNVDGSNFHKVSVVDDQDLEFFDAQYLPSGKMVVCSNLGYHGVPCVNGSDAVGNYTLYDPKTHELRRLCFDQDNNWNATVLKNGKVMYTRWEYTDLTHYYSRIVFTMNPDGTEQRALFGSGSMFPNSTFDMQQLPENSNRFIGVISGHHGTARSGRLIIFDPTKNRAGADGMVQELPYSQRPIETLVIDQLVDGVWPQFLKPHPLTDKYFLVTAKLSPESLWGIYLIDIYDNMTLVTECEGEGYINSIPLRKVQTPVNIPERIPMDLSKASKEATMFIQDLYEGEGLKGVPRGTVKQLRIFAYEYDYLHTQSDHIGQGIQSGWDIKRLLGYVPVEADGSAIFTVPANTPLSIQPIDSMGRAIQWMRSWTLGMPGETVSCVGCHENQNQIAKPKRTIASTIKPHPLTPDAHGVRAINFEQDIQPILNRACIACHNTEKHAAGIDYTAGRMDSVDYWDGVRCFSKSYLQFHPYFYRQGPETEMEVLNPYEYSAYNSDMPQMLRAGHHGVKLTDEEMRTIYLWLDFNVPYYNNLKAELHKTPTGDTIDQKARRIELSAKYSGHAVNWEKELNDYQAYLESLPAVTPVLPEKPAPVKPKEIKVKGFPFTAEEAKAKQGENATKVVELAPGITVEFVRIPAGTYIMGNDKVMSAERRKVTIKKPFWMATTELSNAQVRTMLPKHDSRCIGQHWKDHTTPGYPVNADTLVATKLSYNDCIEFCRLLSEKTGLNVTIPTEEQWEWAARAGSDQDFWFGNVNADYGAYENMGDSQLSKMAVTGINPQPMSPQNPIYKWCAYIPRDKDVNDHHMLLTSSKYYKPNPWGLYDMNGNVAEWTKSVFYPDKTNTNTPEYIVRGGSWYDRAKRSTNASQRSFLPWIKVWNAGIRIIIED